MNSAKLTSLLLEDDFDAKSELLDVEVLPGTVGIFTAARLYHTGTIADVSLAVSSLVSAGAKPKISDYRTRGGPVVMIPVEGFAAMNEMINDMGWGLSDDDLDLLNRHGGSVEPHPVNRMWIEVEKAAFDAAFGSEYGSVTESEEDYPEFDAKSEMTHGKTGPIKGCVKMPSDAPQILNYDVDYHYWISDASLILDTLDEFNLQAFVQAATDGVRWSVGVAILPDSKHESRMKLISSRGGLHNMVVSAPLSMLVAAMQTSGAPKATIDAFSDAVERSLHVQVLFDAQTAKRLLT